MLVQSMCHFMLSNPLEQEKRITALIQPTCALAFGMDTTMIHLATSPFNAGCESILNNKTKREIDLVEVHRCFAIRVSG